MGTPYLQVEFTEYTSPDGKTIHLDRLPVGIVMSDETGMGMPDVRWISQQSPFQHGVTIYDYRLQQRTIQMTIRKNTCSRDDYWTARNTILDALRPNRQYFGQFALGTLLKTFPDGRKRAIDVLVDQGPVFTGKVQGRWDEFSFMDTVRFIAPDPTFYDPTQVQYSRIFACSGYHVLPFSFENNAEMTFDDEGDYAANWDVTYIGTWHSYPTFVITGPLSNVVIWNLTTEKKIDISSYDILSGETVTVVLDFGNKAITSDVNGNIISYVSSDSDLVDFYVACDPEAPDGENNITVFGDGALTGSTEIYLRFYTRYIGI